MPSVTVARQRRTVARRNGPNDPILELPAPPVGNQGNLPPNNDNFTMENVEMLLAQIHGSLLSVGNALLGGSSRMQLTNIRTREAMYRNSFSYEERRTLATTLEYVKEDVAIMADRLDMALSGIRAVSSHIRLLDRNAQNGAAAARRGQREQNQGRGRRRLNAGNNNGRVEEIGVRMRQVRITPVNFHGEQN